MVRTPCYDKNGVKKGAWCQEEDDKLRAYIQRYGHWNWSELPKFAGLSRCGKSCRLRWMNYLRPNVKRGNYTQEEDDLIIKLHKELGNKWCMIAAKLPGRTDNEIKNHWHTSLKKRAKQNTTTSCEEKDVVHETVLAPKILESSQLSLEHSSSEASSSSSILSSDNYAPAPSTINLAKEDSNPVAASTDSFFELNDDFWTEPFLADTYQDDFPLTLAEGGFIFPYISYGEDVEDLLYKIMQEFPEEY